MKLLFATLSITVLVIFGFQYSSEPLNTPKPTQAITQEKSTHIESGVSSVMPSAPSEKLPDNTKVATEVASTVNKSPEQARSGELAVEDNPAATINPQELAKTGQWSDFIQSIDSLDAVDEESLNTAIKLAIQFNAPIWVFEDLLFRGAVFNHEHLFQLVRNSQLALLESLVPLGLDIHIQAPNGSNAIHLIMDMMSDTEMFFYMINHRVNVKSKVSGIDPLTKALTRVKSTFDPNQAIEYQSSKFNMATLVCSDLVMAGAQIEAAHLDLMREIKGLSEKTYDYIVYNAEALKID